jgi:hypothetical protein
MPALNIDVAKLFTQDMFGKDILALHASMRHFWPIESLLVHESVTEAAESPNLRVIAIPWYEHRFHKTVVARPNFVGSKRRITGKRLGSSP